MKSVPEIINLIVSLFSQNDNLKLEKRLPNIVRIHGQ